LKDVSGHPTRDTLFDNLGIYYKEEERLFLRKEHHTRVSPWRKPCGNLGSKANGFAISKVQSINDGHVSQAFRYASYRVRRVVW
jgi:hypothetical protein